MVKFIFKGVDITQEIQDLYLQEKDNDRLIQEIKDDFDELPAEEQARIHAEVQRLKDLARQGSDAAVHVESDPRDLLK